MVTNGQSWAMMGSVVVAMVTTVILSDTVKYYDHFGFTDKKLAIGLAVGTLAVLYVSPSCRSWRQISSCYYNSPSQSLFLPRTSY